MKSLDPSRDALGVRLYRATKLHDTPSYVKTASDDQLLGTANLPAHAYALPGSRAFPIHTAAATWFSAAALRDLAGDMTASKYAMVEAAIRTAGEYWGISGDLARIDAKTAASAEDDLAALPDSDFTIVGPDGRNGPLRNPSEIKAAASWLVRYRDAFAAPARKTAAMRIVGKAVALGVDLGDEGDVLDRMAGLGGCGAKTASTLLRDRAIRLRGIDPALAESLDSTASGIERGEIDIQDHDIVSKLAAVVDDIDRMRKFDRLYGADVERPDDALYAVTEKVAGEWLNSRATAADGSVYAVSDLGRLKLADVRDVGGDRLVAALSEDGLTLEIEKVARAIVSLDHADATLFGMACEAAGIAPIGRESIASPRFDLVGLGLALGQV